MHFLPTLFLVVLAYPLMRKAIDAPALGAVALIVCLMSRWQFDQFLYSRLWDDPNILAIGRSVKIITHIGYGMVAATCLGLWQKHRQQELESWVPPVLYLAVLMMIFKGFGTWQTIETGAWSHNFQPGFWADFTMPALLFTTFMLLGHRQWWSGFSRYAKYAFGIYLCHPIFLDFCEILLVDQSMSPLLQVLTKIAVTGTATVLFVTLLARHSAVAWTIGLGKPPLFSLPKLHSRRAE
jgi:surface polysaccharide O-acyltransferase-like enzyme